MVAFLSNESSVKQLRQDKAYNTQLLQENFQIGAPQIEALYFFAKFQFDCGSYSEAAETLFHCRRACVALLPPANQQAEKGTGLRTANLLSRMLASDLLPWSTVCSSQKSDFSALQKNRHMPVGASWSTL